MMSEDQASSSDAIEDDAIDEDAIDDDEGPEVEGFMRFDPLGGMGTVMPAIKPITPGTGPVSPGSTTAGDKPGSGGPSTVNFPRPA